MFIMGGNGSYSKLFSGVSESKMTHTEAKSRIDGHKILVQKENDTQIQIPMNSNSENPTYLCAKKDKDGNVVIKSIAEYKDHKIVKTIDLEFDEDGNYIPYSPDKKSSHCHKWDESDSGNMGRKRHDKSNVHPISEKDKELIKKIVEYNKENHKWKDEKSQ